MIRKIFGPRCGGEATRLKSAKGQDKKSIAVSRGSATEVRLSLPYRVVVPQKSVCHYRTVVSHLTGRPLK